MAGAIVVLMHEAGLRFHDGITVLVSSAVPEGLGVSSSAALEVATMQALATAHGLQLDGRELALLCQKVRSRAVSGVFCGYGLIAKGATGQETMVFSLNQGKSPLSTKLAYFAKSWPLIPGSMWPML